MTATELFRRTAARYGLMPTEVLAFRDWIADELATVERFHTLADELRARESAERDRHAATLAEIELSRGRLREFCRHLHRGRADARSPYRCVDCGMVMEGGT